MDDTHQREAVTEEAAMSEVEELVRLADRIENTNSVLERSKMQSLIQEAVVRLLRHAALTQGGLRPPAMRPQQSGKEGGIMLEMAQASREQEMWERRFEAICRTHPVWRSADHDGSFGLRDFLEYIAPICGFDASKVRGSQQSGNSHG